MSFGELPYDIMELIYNEKVKIEKLEKIEKSAKAQYPRVVKELNLIFNHIFAEGEEGTELDIDMNSPEQKWEIIYLSGVYELSMVRNWIFRELKSRKSWFEERQKHLKERFMDTPLGECFIMIQSKRMTGKPLKEVWRLRDTKKHGFKGIKIPRNSQTYHYSQPASSLAFKYFDDTESEEENEDIQIFLQLNAQQD